MKSLLDTLHGDKVQISKKHTFFRAALYETDKKFGYM